MDDGVKIEEGMGASEIEAALNAVHDDPPVGENDEPGPEITPEGGETEPGKEPEKPEDKETPPEGEQPKTQPEKPSKAKGLRETIKEQNRQIRQEKENRVKAELENLKLRAEMHKELSEDELDLLYENDRNAYTDYIREQATRKDVSKEISAKEEELAGIGHNEALQEFQDADVQFQAELAGINLDYYPEMTPELQAKLTASINTPEYRAVAKEVNDEIQQKGQFPSLKRLMQIHHYVNREAILAKEREKAGLSFSQNVKSAREKTPALSTVKTDRDESAGAFDLSKLDPAKMDGMGKSDIERVLRAVEAQGG